MKKQILMMAVIVVGSLQIFCMDKKEVKTFEKSMKSILERCAACPGEPVCCPGLNLGTLPQDRIFQQKVAILDRVKGKHFPTVAIALNSIGEIRVINDGEYAQINQEMIASGTYHHYRDDNTLVASLTSGVQSDYIKRPGKKQVAVPKGAVTLSTFEDLGKKQQIEAFLAMMSGSRK
jgi:hypothetical protein